MANRYCFRKSRRAVCFICLIYALLFFHFYFESVIPDEIYIGASRKDTLCFNIPFTTLQSDSTEVVLTDQSNIPSQALNLTLDESFGIYAEEIGSYELSLKLFGWFDYKSIHIEVIEDSEVIPCGQSIGIYLESDGILVVGTSAITDEKGQLSSPCGDLLKSGDYIIAVDGEGIAAKEELIRAIDSCSGSAMILTIRRGEKQSDVTIQPVKVSGGQYRLGIWVRDDTQGIGTLTYVTEDGRFGALGHGISDSDVGEIVTVKNGTLYQAKIQDVMKGTMGHPGSLSGSICYGTEYCLGQIQKNTDCGIFGQANGTLLQSFQREPIPIGYKQEVEEGEATILCSIDGTVQEYRVMISNINKSSSAGNKGMVVQVTDPVLLERTGGIVQGMSGSPILQNGKIVGAVTHVFVNDPTRGYGIFIENMLNAAG